MVNECSLRKKSLQKKINKFINNFEAIISEAN